MLQQNQGAPKPVRVECIRPFQKVTRDENGLPVRDQVQIGDVVELPADAAADVVSCGKAERTDKQVAKAAGSKSARAKRDAE